MSIAHVITILIFPLHCFIKRTTYPTKGVEIYILASTRHKQQLLSFLIFTHSHASLVEFSPVLIDSRASTFCGDPRDSVCALLWFCCWCKHMAEYER
jgi:hypothetical protein